jgi:hypothetical protein
MWGSRGGGNIFKEQNFFSFEYFSPAPLRKEGIDKGRE